MPVWLHALRASFTFLTRIPVGGFPYPPKTWEWISIWFPFVGALIGVLQTIVWLALNDYSDPTRAIIAVIIASATIFSSTLARQSNFQTSFLDCFFLTSINN